jgi:hypothetical protein
VAEQRINQGAAGMPRPGVDWHVRRLIDNDQVFVLVNDVEVDRLCLWRCLYGRRDSDRELFGTIEAFAGLTQRLTVSRDAALFDQALGLGTRDIAQARNRYIEPFPRAVGGDLMDRLTLRGRAQSPPAFGRSRR